MSGNARERRHVSRRGLLGAVGAAGVAGLGAGGLTGYTAAAGAGERTESALAAARSRGGPEDGRPPALLTPTPAHVRVVAVDVLAEDGTETREAAREVLAAWSREARALHERGPAALGEGAPTQGMHPASLGVTLGLGPSLLERAGLADRRPPRMEDLPAFGTDQLNPDWCGGDLMLHVGAEDPVVLSAAVDHLLRTVRGRAGVRWALPGFQRSAAAAVDPEATPRNLMGQVDGTVNPRPDEALFGTQVLASHTERPLAWMDGGSYVVVRRIRMLLDDWFALEPRRREEVIGRRLADGAPLGGDRERDRPDLSALDDAGEPVIARDAHIRLASPESTLGARMLRRGFNYDLGWDTDGRRQAGLLFTAWQADPRTGFTAVQRGLDEGHDALGAYVRHEGSALFAVPPVREGEPHVAHSLL
ncbi:Dyp-type peroxidase [Nocardiopsis halotolerans]|uniref:Dyp-type peroxidase n=1 Tax=Nocardiopsis halotolerans TaxID=124252 RepID=UPI00034705B3|nr:Dyp-type peroxidase [Nocardiopsis halotolerans]